MTEPDDLGRQAVITLRELFNYSERFDAEFRAKLDQVRTKQEFLDLIEGSEHENLKSIFVDMKTDKFLFLKTPLGIWGIILVAISFLSNLSIVTFGVSFAAGYERPLYYSGFGLIIVSQFFILARSKGQAIIAAEKEAKAKAENNTGDDGVVI